jgi:hypothetical protein
MLADITNTANQSNCNQQQPQKLDIGNSLLRLRMEAALEASSTNFEGAISRMKSGADTAALASKSSKSLVSPSLDSRSVKCDTSLDSAQSRAVPLSSAGGGYKWPSFDRALASNVPELLKDVKDANSKVKSAVLGGPEMDSLAAEPFCRAVTALKAPCGDSETCSPCQAERQAKLAELHDTLRSLRKSGGLVNKAPLESIEVAADTKETAPGSPGASSNAKEIPRSSVGAVSDTTCSSPGTSPLEASFDTVNTSVSNADVQPKIEAKTEEVQVVCLESLRTDSTREPAPEVSSARPKRAASRPPPKPPPPAPPKGAGQGEKLDVKVKQTYRKQEHASIFNGQADVSSKEVALLKAQVTKLNAERRSSLPINTPVKNEQPAGIFGRSRALNFELAFKQSALPPSDLAAVLRALNFRHSKLDAEALQRLLLPSKEESDQILKHDRESTLHSLSDVEKNLLPLCKLPDADRRLNITVFALSHTTQFAMLRSQLTDMADAAKEAMACKRLQDVFVLSLKIINVINHGEKTGAEAFPLSSFQSFAQSKGGLALQTLCKFLCPEGVTDLLEFIEALGKDLANVARAARHSERLVFEDGKAFRQKIDMVREHLTVENDSSAEWRCSRLLEELKVEEEQLEQAEELFKTLAKEARLFFGETKNIPFEELLANILLVKDELQKASNRFHEYLDRCEQDLQDAAIAWQIEAASSSDTNRGANDVEKTELSASSGPSVPRTAPTSQTTGSEVGCAASAGSDERAARHSTVDLRQSRKSFGGEVVDARVSWLADGETVANAVTKYNEFCETKL